jgi:hypothetical protein
MASSIFNTLSYLNVSQILPIGQTPSLVQSTNGFSPALLIGQREYKYQLGCTVRNVAK